VNGKPVRLNTGLRRSAALVRSVVPPLRHIRARVLAPCCAKLASLPSGLTVPLRQLGTKVLAPCLARSAWLASPLVSLARSVRSRTITPSTRNCASLATDIASSRRRAAVKAFKLIAAKSLSLPRRLGSAQQHIRVKIITPYLVLCVILAVIGTYLVTQLVAGSLQERFDNQLAEAGRVAADAVVRTEQQQLETARAMAFTQGVPEAASARDATGLRNLISPLAANEGIDRAEIVDDRGRLLADIVADDAPAIDPSVSAGDPSQWGVVQEVLSGSDDLGDKYASLVQTDRGFYLFTAAPLMVWGQTVGAVLVGTPIESLLTEAKSQALADITFYTYDGKPLASTFVLAKDENDTPNLDLGPALAADVLNMEHASPRDSRSLFDRNYDFAYSRLMVRQSAVGLYSVALPTNFILSAGVATRLNMSILFGLAISAVLIIGYVLARRITDPILKLVRASKSVAAGDFKTRSGVRSNDEIGLLAQSFDQMTEGLQRRTEQLRLHNVNTVKAFTSAVDARDPYTLGHSVRVGRLASLLAEQLGLSEEVREAIELGGYLHDIGKIGVRDAVLLKPGPLTTEERTGIDQHPIVACRILESLDLSREILGVVRSHHERLDGSGYPDGLKGNDVPLVARIAAIADVYDAMTSLRPYKAALSPETALAELKSQAGRLLDPDVVTAFEAILPKWKEQQQSDASLRRTEATGEAAPKAGRQQHSRTERWDEENVA
jgi:putative nucleotidyltransferase with HDIG domain